MKAHKAALLSISLLCSVTAAFAGDAPLGHVSLAKGKYVMTNTDSGASFIVSVDENGIMVGSKEKAAAMAGTQAAPSAAVPAVPGAVPATAAAAAAVAAGANPAVASKHAALTDAIMGKIKGEATRAATKALTGGQVNSLMKKVGADKYLK